MRLMITAAAILLAASGGLAQDAERRIAWNKPMEPFRVVGPIYHVGPAGISAFLIADKAGHVLIDGGLPESAPLIQANIRKLGFDVRDVRYLLVSHAHYDHVGGLAALKRASGGKVVVGRGDAADLAAGRTLDRNDIDGFPAVSPDQVVGQGDVVRSGAAVLTAQATPGHTAGCTSWSMRVREVGRPINVLFACSLTTAGRVLLQAGKPTPAVAEFGESFARLKRLRADVFLTFHAEFYDLAAKRARQVAGDANAFVDPGELERRRVSAERAFAAELERQRAGQL